jgi:signal transduction histidine kinase
VAVDSIQSGYQESMKRKSLSKRIFWWMAFVGLVPLIGMAVLGYFWIVREIVHAQKENLLAVLESRYSLSTRVFDGLNKDFYTAVSSECIKALRQVNQISPKQSPHHCNVLDSLCNRDMHYKKIFIYDADWNIIASSRLADNTLQLPPAWKERFRQHDELIILEDFDYRDDAIITQVGRSFANGDSMAYFVAVLDLYRLTSQLVKCKSCLGKTGKIYVLSKDNRYIAPPNDLTELLGEKSNIPVKMATDSGNSVMRYKDWRGVPVLGASISFPHVDLRLVAEIDEAEVYILPRQLIISIGIISLFTLVVIFFISAISSRSLSSSLGQLARFTKSISSENYAKRAPTFADKETQEVGLAFNQMLDRLEVSQRALINAASLAVAGELSSSLAHEMKSPLSSIKINLQALGKKVSGDPVYSEMADISLQQVQRLETMLSELLNFSKPLKLNPERLSFAELKEEVMYAIGRKIEQRGLILVIEDRLEDLSLYIDREHMVRALTALIDNAVQWSPPGGRITLSGKKMEDGKSWLMVQVADEGPGIQDRHRKRLFMPFFTTRPGGTGLGLTNVRKIVEHHGGTVFAEMNVSRGAVFTIQLPLMQPEA